MKLKEELSLLEAAERESALSQEEERKLARAFAHMLIRRLELEQISSLLASEAEMKRARAGCIAALVA